MKRPLRRAVATFVSALAALAVGAISADADEAGISFWVPGTYGALAAAPLPPGFSLAEVYYHSPIKAGADVATAIQIPRAGVTAKLRHSGLSPRRANGPDVEHSNLCVRDARVWWAAFGRN